MPSSLARRTVLLAPALLPAACDLPRDPRGTSGRVTRGVLRVGVAGNPPWTEIADVQVGGVEIALIEDFALSLEARPAWVPGTESRLLEALERFELDVVVGGLTRDTPWRDRIGPSRPYLTTRSLIGLAPGTAAPTSFEGLRVLVRQGEAAAQRLRARGAVPVVVDRIAPGQAPAAVEDWELPGLGLRDGGITLREVRHIMAVPPGENGFLLRLERFLLPRETAAWEALRRAAG